MYSVVLLVALTGGTDTPAFGKGCSGCSGCYGCCGGWSSCYGCSGCSGCSGCWGSCSGSCHGRGHKGHKSCKGGGLFSKMGHKHGCCGGCHGCHGGCYGSCNGGCYGSCNGGCNGSYNGGCNGSCNGGCVGSYNGGCVGYEGGNGCVGAPIVAPSVAPVVIPEKKMSQASAPATIIVRLPAEAKLTVDGNVTTSTSAQRVFVSPALEQGQEYFYTLTAEVVRDGKSASRTERIAVRAGEETNVNITFPATVASK